MYNNYSQVSTQNTSGSGLGSLQIVIIKDSTASKSYHKLQQGVVVNPDPQQLSYASIITTMSTVSFVFAALGVLMLIFFPSTLFNVWKQPDLCVGDTCWLDAFVVSFFMLGLYQITCAPINYFYTYLAGHTDILSKFSKQNLIIIGVLNLTWIFTMIFPFVAYGMYYNNLLLGHYVDYTFGLSYLLPVMNSVISIFYLLSVSELKQQAIDVTP
eukprot:403344801